MKKLGIDIGSSTIKMTLIKDNKIEKSKIINHKGRLVESLLNLIKELDNDNEFKFMITGSNSQGLLNKLKNVDNIEEIPAIIDGHKFLGIDAGSIIEIGSQGSRFITNIKEMTPRFSVNDHCAGGTGSFFEDQMSRLGMEIEDYSKLVEKARSIPTLSGRCSVFAKTDIIHRQQEGFTKEDILKGLCYAMIKNYKATIVKGMPLQLPVAFYGGVTLNTGVIEAIEKVFKIKKEELLIPKEARFISSIGAAINAKETVIKNELITMLEGILNKSVIQKSLEPLKLVDGSNLRDPECTNIIPEEGCYLGIDIGSTSTDLVLIDETGNVLDLQYLRTSGEPEKVLRRGMKIIKEKYSDIKILGVGITGSGRERLGKMIGADVIRDEITAQAKAAAHFVPTVDTVFEIGGQDSKYISIKDKKVVDFQMNKICAAGTGSFVEEQSIRMGIPISDFGGIALQGKSPCDLGERCTVFIETAIADEISKGATHADIASGLCYSVIKNYLHKVVGNKPVGQSIVLQGGVNYNAGIVAAFQYYYGDKITISPVFSISGAVGAALLAKEEVDNKETTFLGFDFDNEIEIKSKISLDEIRKNKAFYKKAGQFMIEDYDVERDPNKKTVGVPLSLIMFKFFPMINEFFKNLGYNVVLSKPTNEETIALSQETATGETCYPIKLLYGHMMELAQQKVDYIFFPAIHTILHPHAKAKHSYSCPYMQMSGKAIFKNLKLEESGIELINPVFDLDIGIHVMAKAMIKVGADLGFSKAKCMTGLIKGGMAVQKITKNIEDIGEDLLKNIDPDEKVLILMTRNYGVSDPVLNMGIPEILLQKGYKVITLSHIPGMDLDISKEYPNMYWPFGDHVISGVKLVANHPNLYPIYLTNHGCGPDSLLSHMFKEEMGDKPYLQIEVDEHFSKVGVMTRIEAFLNSISNIKNKPIPKGFEIRNVNIKNTNIASRPDKDRTLYIPNIGYYTKYLIQYFEANDIKVKEMPKFDKEILNLGRARMNSKEYLPLPMLLGACLKVLETEKNVQFLIPFNYGADSDGMYARAIRTLLDIEGYESEKIIAPVMEELPEKALNIDLLFRAILTGDLVNSIPYSKRDILKPKNILSYEELIVLANEIKEYEVVGRKLYAIGDILSVFALDEGILEKLEVSGDIINRMPLSELLLFMWKEEKISKKLFNNLSSKVIEISKAMEKRSPFSENIEGLIDIADKYISDFSANNGRYRYSKAVDRSNKASAVINISPRYENTAMSLNMLKLAENCKSPVFELSVDGDYDNSNETKLMSFLYYCK